MKRRTAAALALAFLLAGCTPAGERTVPEQNPSVLEEEPDGAVEPAESEAGKADREENPPSLEGIEGDCVLLYETFLDDPSPAGDGDYLYLESAMDFYGMVVLAWNVSNGFQGPTLIEGISTGTGENLFRMDKEGYAYRVEATGELPENYRVVMRERTVYLASGDAEREVVYNVPAQVVDSFWEDSFAGAPYDYARGRELLAWCGDDGIYVASGDGSGAELRLANSGIEAILAAGPDPSLHGERIEYSVPDWDEMEYRYVAPLLLGGGRQVLATAWASPLAYPDSEPVLLFAAWVDLETGETGHSGVQFNPNSGPAVRHGGSSVRYNAYGGICMVEFGLDGVEVTLAPYDEEYYLDEHTLDCETFYRVQETADGKQALIQYNRTDPEDALAWMAADRDALAIRQVMDTHVLCQAYSYEPDRTELLLIRVG